MRARLTLQSIALGCSTGRYPALSARSVDGGVSSIASSRRAPPRDSPPSTTAAPCPARSENSPHPAAPSRHRAIASPASAADAAASCRLQPFAMQHGIDLPRTNIAPHHCPSPTRREIGWRRRGGRRSRAGGRRRMRSPRRERTVRSSFGRAITWRRQPLNSQTQVIQAGLDQRFFSSVFVAGSWMMPRLPVNRPRCGVATISPVGVTRFCRGIGSPLPLNAGRGKDRRSGLELQCFDASTLRSPE